MAEAKIKIETLADNKELKSLNNALAEGTQKLKDMQKELKAMEKAGNADEKAMASLRAEIQMQKTVNQQYAKAVKNTANELTNAAKSATQSKSAFSDFSKLIGDKLGIDISNLNLSLTAMVGTLATVAGALVASGREVSGFINQFKAFAGSVEGATAMYNRFNEVYRNTNYDEQAVYDMAKALMRIGINAEDSASLIEKCADAAASLGQGQEYASQLADTLAKVKVGGELTQKQLVELAKAGIDLNDVQDEIRQGGEAAYNALIKKLEQFQGGMADSKQTAAEMEGDIKGNLVEIGRQAALLIDDFFGFSDMLKSFYQWVIDTTQTCINSIKSMIATLREAKASAGDHADVLAEIGTMEEAIGDKSGEAAVEAAAAWQRTYNERMTALKAERKDAEELNKIYEGINVAGPVKSIAKSSGAVSGGGGGSRSSAVTTKEEDPIIAWVKAEQKKFEIMKAEQDYKLALDAQYQETYNARMAQEIEMFNNKLTQELEMEGLTAEQKLAIWKAYIARKQDLTKGNTKTEENEYANLYRRMASMFSSAIGDCISGAKSFGEAFKGIIQQIIQQLITAAAYAAILSAIPGMGGFAANFKGFLGIGSGGKKADGGYISGPGTGTSDSAGLYALSNGEYVLNARAVEMVGLDNLNRINGAGRMASGGAVAGGAIGGNVTLNVSAMDASGFGDFLSRGGLDSIKQALYDDDRMFASSAGVF